MIRIKLIHEGRVVKKISSRLHESVVLEQLAKFKGPVDEIEYDGKLSEGAKEILQKVAKRVIPAAMAAGIALGGANAAQAQNYFPGTNQSVGGALADIFSPNYRHNQTLRRDQRQAELNRDLKSQRAYNREIERAEVERARTAGRRAAGAEMPANVRVYDEARPSRDGRFINLYGQDHRVIQIPRRGTEFVQANSQRPAHYIVQGGQVYYVRHVNESAIGTIAPVSAVKPSATGKAAPVAKNTNAGTDTANNTADDKNDDEMIAAIKRAGIKLSELDETAVNEIIRKVKDGYRLYSHSGKNLGTFDSRSAAEKHEQEVNYFKHVKEAVEDTALLDILNKHSSSWEKFKQGGDITDNDAFYNELFSYFIDSGLMPYTVAKASNEDPAEWITNKLDLMMNENKAVDPADIDPVSADATDQALADKNIIMQIRRAADYDAVTKLHLGDGTKFAIKPAAAAKLLDMFDRFKPDSKLLMQKVLNKKSGIQQLLSHLGESAELDEVAPPGKKAEDFIKKNKDEFEKRYGKRGKAVLYATAWKLFGESVDESVLGESDSVYNAIMYRISLDHLDLVKKYGIEKVHSAAAEQAHYIGDVEEIGSSDVTAWTNAVVRDLERAGATNEDAAGMDIRLQKYIANFPDEVGNTVDELKKKIEQDKGESRFKWAIGRLPDGRFLSGLAGTIKDKFQLPIVAQGVVEAEENTAYQSLNDVYPTGATEIWYWKDGLGRDFMMGYDWLKQRRSYDLKPYPASISDTHVLVGKIKETDPDKIYHMMQGEIWSPRGEARGMIKALGTGHTSMSVGDIVKIGSQYLMVDRFGFRNIENGKVVESMQSASPYMDPKKTAALIASRIFDQER